MSSKTVARVRSYARVENGVVREIYTPPPEHAHLEIHDLFGGQLWVEVTHAADPVEQGHGYDHVSGAFSRPVVAMPTPEQEAALLMRRGLPVVSAVNPALNGTYPITSEKQRYVAALMQRLEMGGGFPGGVAAIAWKDVDGVAHEMTREEFARFAAAMSDVVFDLMAVTHGHGTALPRLPVSIDAPVPDGTGNPTTA